MRANVRYQICKCLQRRGFRSQTSQFLGLNRQPSIKGSAPGPLGTFDPHSALSFLKFRISTGVRRRRVFFQRRCAVGLFKTTLICFISCLCVSSDNFAVYFMQHTGRWTLWFSVTWSKYLGKMRCRMLCVDAAPAVRADMTFATNCLQASGIIRKQLVQLDSLMHPSSQQHHQHQQLSLGDDGPVTSTPRSLIMRSP